MKKSRQEQIFFTWIEIKLTFCHSRWRESGRIGQLYQQKTEGLITIQELKNRLNAGYP